MTTYTLSGLTVYYDQSTGDPVGLGSGGVTLDLVVPESITTMSYVVNPPQPGDGPGDETVDITVDAYTLRIDGDVVGTSPANDPVVSIFEVLWTDSGGISRSSTVLVPRLDNITAPGLGVVDADYIFVISGDPLPSVSSLADWAALDAAVTGISVPTGAYGPGVAIPLTSLGATISEDDRISGTPGDDDMAGGVGRDTILGEGGDDILRGGADNDTLRGQGGNDMLLGGAGRDRLFGGNGSDILVGGKGNDVLNPGDNTGLDVIVAGRGQDKIVLSGVSTGSVRIEHDDLAAGIVADIDGNADTGTITKTGAGVTTIIDVANPMLAEGLVIAGTGFDDVFNITVADGGRMAVTGGDGVDSFSVAASTGTAGLFMKDGTQGVRVNLALGVIDNDGFGNSETIAGPGRFELVAGFTEADRLTGSGAAERLEGGDGNDVLRGGGGADELLGGNDRDRLFGGKGNDLLQGDDGNDFLRGDGGRDRLEGGAGRDTMLGGAGNDRMLGGKGNDRLDGGDGNDRMTGNGGNDRFVFSFGNDVITDFDAVSNQEKIDLGGVAAITDFTVLTNGYLSETGGNAVIADGAGNTLTLIGVGMADLDQGDFIF